MNIASELALASAPYLKKKGKQFVQSQAKKLIKQAKKKINNSQRGKNALVIANKAKDIIAGEITNQRKFKQDCFLNSLYPNAICVSRPIYRQATKALYLKNITKSSQSSDTNGVCYMSFNPWSLVNAIYIGTSSSTTAISSTTVASLQNQGSLTALASFKSYRVIASKITIINRQAPLTATGIIQMGFFDIANDPSYANNIPNSTSQMQQCERYAEAEVPHLTTLYVPQHLTDRTYSSTQANLPAYPGDMFAFFATGLPVTPVVCFDFVIEQDIELEPTPGTLYSMLSGVTEISRPDLNPKLDTIQDRISMKVAYTNEDELYAYTHGINFNPGNRNKGSRMKFN